MKKLIFLIILLLPLEIYAQTRSFDGVDQFITIDNESNFDFEYDESFSFELWLKHNQTLTVGGGILDKCLEPSPYTGWTLLLEHRDTDELNIHLIMIGAAYDTGQRIIGYCDTDWVLLKGEWHHLAVTYNGNGSYTGIKFYIDGILDTTKTVADHNTCNTSIKNNNTVNMGRKRFAGIQFLAYAVDEVRIYNYVRTPEQIESNIDKVTADEESELIAYWNFDETTGGIFDRSGNANHAIAIEGTLTVDNAPVRRIIGE